MNPVVLLRRVSNFRVSHRPGSRDSLPARLTSSDQPRRNRSPTKLWSSTAESKYRQLFESRHGTAASWDVLFSSQAHGAASHSAMRISVRYESRSHSAHRGGRIRQARPVRIGRSEVLLVYRKSRLLTRLVLPAVFRYIALPQVVSCR